MIGASNVRFICQLSFVFIIASCEEKKSCPEEVGSDPALKYKEPLIDKMTNPKERSFIMIKPDGVDRGLVAEIISRFEKRGYQLIAMKMVKPTEAFAKAHYDDLKDKGFFGGLCKFLSSGPCVAMVWQGKDVVRVGRVMIGATDPLASTPGTIRGDFAIETGRNVIHGSDSVVNGEKEIALWFKPEEIMDWKPTQYTSVYE